MFRALGYLWASGQSLLTLLAFGLLAIARQVAWAGVAEGVLQFVVCSGAMFDRVRGRFNGFSGGWVVLFTEESIRWEWTRGHEIDGHTFSQHFVWGPLFPLLYVLAGCVAVLAGGHFYRDNVFERKAREIGELRNLRAAAKRNAT